MFCVLSAKELHHTYICMYVVHDDVWLLDYCVHIGTMNVSACISVEDGQLNV
jgi:hypothetical protein